MIYNSKMGAFPGKLTLGYIGPYQIAQEVGQGTFMVVDVFGTKVHKPVNGFRLKKFQGKPPHLDLPQFGVAESNWCHIYDRVY